MIFFSIQTYQNSPHHKFYIHETKNIPGPDYSPSDG